MKNKIQKLIAFLLLTLGISFVSLAQRHYKETVRTQGEDVSIESLAINKRPRGPEFKRTRILAKNGVEFAITFPEKYQNLSIVRSNRTIEIQGRKVFVVEAGVLSFEFSYTENGVSYICDILGDINYYGELSYNGKSDLQANPIEVKATNENDKLVVPNVFPAKGWGFATPGLDPENLTLEMLEKFEETIFSESSEMALKDLLRIGREKGYFVNGKVKIVVAFGDTSSNALPNGVPGASSLQIITLIDARTYNLNLSQEGQGTVSVSKNQLKPGESATLTAQAAQGWRFDHWEENGQNVTENPLTITMETQDRSIKAVFTELPKPKVNVVLQIVDTNGGELAPSQSQEVTSGGSVTFQVPNLANVNFKGWKRNGQMVDTGSSYTLSNVTQNETIQAIFEVPVQSLSLSFSTLSVKEGESKDLPSVTVVPSDAADQAITWTSNSPAVAKVENGKVVGLLAGTARLEASSTNGKKAVLTVTVSQREETQPQPQPAPQPQPRPEPQPQPQPSEPKAVESLSLSFSTLSLKEGESKGLPSVTVVPSDAADQAIIWTSNSPAVAKVENGKVVGLAAGTATLEASSTNGKKAVLTVTVSQREETQPQPQPAPQPQPSPAPQPQPQPSEPKAVESLSLSFSTLSVKEGESKALPSVTVVPSDAADQAITWTSNSPAVAKVENGKVVGLLAGTARLEASSTNGKKAVLTVTVSQREETQPQPQPSPEPQPQPQPSEPSEQEALPPYIASFPTEVAPQEQISLTPWQGLGSIAVEQIRYHLTDADGNTLSQAIGKIENQKLVFTQAGTYRLVAELPNNPEGWTDIEYLITVK
nr:Ig-like domain-containing protein [uncultured Capnocytophaga sp.]